MRSLIPFLLCIAGALRACGGADVHARPQTDDSRMPDTELTQPPTEPATPEPHPEPAREPQPQPQPPATPPSPPP